VFVVRLFHLILDDHPAVFLSAVLAQEVCSEGSDFLLLRLKLEVNTQCFAEKFEVLWLSEPGSEVLVFAGPDFSEVYGLYSPELLRSSRPINERIAVAGGLKSSLFHFLQPFTRYS